MHPSDNHTKQFITELWIHKNLVWSEKGLNHKIYWSSSKHETEKWQSFLADITMRSLCKGCYGSKRFEAGFSERERERERERGGRERERERERERKREREDGHTDRQIDRQQTGR